MQFSLSEDQVAFRAQLRALADKHCTTADLRASWDSDTGWSRSRWRELAQLGVTGLTVPERFGGLGLGQVDLVVLLEEAGRSGVPEPMMETLSVGVALLAGGHEELAAHWLPRVAAGDAVLGVAAPGAGGLVNAGADLVLVEQGATLLAIEPTGQAGPARRSIDGARRLVSVDAGAGIVVAEGDRAESLARQGHRLGALGAAAVLVGVADRLIADAASYARARTQFGKAIGSFQAVKHHLASALVRLEFARPLVLGAAWSMDEGELDASRRVSMAKASASDAAVLAARTALQVHGAIGYTWEHDLHLWMKRAWALAAAWGDAGEHRARLIAPT